jgi:hypothetical protein
MKIEKLILHIGPHKTGSTYIQQMLFENAQKLAANGVYYSTEEWIAEYGHHLAAEPDNLLKFCEYINDFELINEKFHSIIISSENFDRLSRDEIALILSKIKMPIQLIYMYRDPFSVLYSHWQEDIKFGSDLSFGDFLGRHLINPSTSIIINPSLILKKWACFFDNNSLAIMNYDLILKAKKNICNEFLISTYGTDFNLEFEVLEINKSLPIEDAELLRFLNSVDLSKNNIPSTDIRSSFFKIRENYPYMDEIKKSILKNIRHINISNDSIFETLTKQFFLEFSRYFISIDSRSVEVTDRFLALPNSRWTIGLDDELNELHNLCRQG